MEFSILSPVSLVLLIDFNGRMMELLFDFLKFEGTCLSSSSSVLRSRQIFWFMRFYLIFKFMGGELVKEDPVEFSVSCQVVSAVS